jgi:myosin heavy subunit
MNVMGLTDQEQSNILQVVAGILHLGNVMFMEKGNYAVIQDHNGKCLYMHKTELFKFKHRLFLQNCFAYSMPRAY